MNLYKTLGLTPDATQDDIKKAWRSLQQKNHPDKADGNKEIFQATQAAYETLSDAEKRAHYDATGEVAQAGPSLRDEAVSLVTQAVDEYLKGSDPDTDNLLVGAAKLIRDGAAAAQDHLDKMNAMIGKARRAAKRAAVKEGKVDVLQSIFLHLQERFKTPIAQAEHHLEISKLAVEILEDHEYVVEVALPTVQDFNNALAQHLRRQVFGM